MSERWEDERDANLNRLAYMEEPQGSKPGGGAAGTEARKLPVFRPPEYGDLSPPKDYLPHYSMNLRNVSHDF